MGSFLAVLFLIVCILLIVVVLLQKGRGGGLGAAFGGSGSSAFGTKTGDVFTWVTIMLTGLFLLLAIITTLVYRPEGGTVAEPVISPGDGTAIAYEQFVTIRTPTPNAAVYYTTDGGEPSEQSKPYTKPFPVTADTTVKAKAFLSGWQPSPTVTAKYVQPEGKNPTGEEDSATQPATTQPKAPATQPEAPASKPAEPAKTQPAPAATQPTDAKK